jgi:hypothetical protein
MHLRAYYCCLMYRALQGAALYWRLQPQRHAPRSAAAGRRASPACHMYLCIARCRVRRSTGACSPSTMHRAVLLQEGVPHLPATCTCALLAAGFGVLLAAAAPAPCIAQCCCRKACLTCSPHVHMSMHCSLQGSALYWRLQPQHHAPRSAAAGRRVSGAASQAGHVQAGGPRCVWQQGWCGGRQRSAAGLMSAVGGGLKRWLYAVLVTRQVRGKACVCLGVAVPLFAADMDSSSSSTSSSLEKIACCV